MIGMEFLLEGALVLLLGAAILQAWRLERALGVLKRDRGELETLVRGFNSATAAAAAGIADLRHSADSAGHDIERQIERATRLQDDLQFLIDRGERLADRLEAPLRQPAPEPPPIMRPARTSETEPNGPARRQSQAERDLMQALRLARP